MTTFCQDSVDSYTICQAIQWYKVLSVCVYKYVYVYMYIHATFNISFILELEYCGSLSTQTAWIK